MLIFFIRVSSDHYNIVYVECSSLYSAWCRWNGRALKYYFSFSLIWCHFISNGHSTIIGLSNTQVLNVKLMMASRTLKLHTSASDREARKPIKRTLIILIGLVLFFELPKLAVGCHKTDQHRNNSSRVSCLCSLYCIVNAHAVQNNGHPNEMNVRAEWKFFCVYYFLRGIRAKRGMMRLAKAMLLLFVYKVQQV